MGLDINLNTSKIDISEDDGLNVDLYEDNIDISDDEADDIIIEITGLKSISKFIGLEDTPLYYDNGKFFKVEDNKIVYTDIEWKDISGNLEDAPEIVTLIENLVEEISTKVVDDHIYHHNIAEDAHPYIQNIIHENYVTLDTKIDDTKEELSQDISNLNVALNQEISDRETADNALSEDIQEEILARIEGDTTLQNEIDTLNTNLQNEIDARIEGDTNLSNSLDELSNSLIQEVLDRQEQDGILQEQITSNYNTLDDKIDTEISDRTSADTTLQDNIDAEALARQNADTTLQGNIDELTQTVEDNNTAVNSRIDETNDTVSDLSDTVTSNYNTLDGKISTEISNRTSADTILQNNIDAEASTRQNADATLQNNIDTETLTRQNADATLQNNIDTEALARQNADATLQGNIDTLSDTVSSNYNDLSDQIDNLSDTVSDNYTDLDDKISDLTDTVNDNDTAINNKVDGINTTLTTSINNLSNTVSSNYTTLDTKIDNTKTSLEGDISDLSDTVSQNYTDLSNAITTSASTINSRIDSEVLTLNTAIGTETTNRQNADNNLQSQIDAIVSSSDVFDIVGTYAELQAYDISTVPVNDIIKVLVDSSHDNAATYYRCIETAGVKSWSYIGSEGAYYTKSESDTKFVAKTTTINNKPLSSNITLTASDVNALPNTTVIGDGILTLQKNGVNIDTFNANATANKSINITVPTDTADLTNGAEFITAASLPIVNNGTLTIQANGITVGTFTANASSDVTANIIVPTKTSDLINDSGYIIGITSSDVTTALGYTPYNATNPNNYITASALNGYATENWVNNQDYVNNTTLATTLNNYVLSTDLADVATTGDYDDLINKPTEVTESTISGWGFTKNTGTVTSVNNTSPDSSGNVTLSIPDTSNLANEDLSNLSSTGNSKFQAPLVSGTNIKTINSTSLLGSGNIAVQPTLVSGTNIKTINSTSLLGSGDVSVQPTITSSAMLSSDLVDDTNKTHKFATSAQLTQIATNTTDISTINGKIPAQATSSNQLADKAFVNSSVQTATANFRGNWDTWTLVPTSASSYPADYAGSTTPTVNDYLVVQDASDYTGDTLEGTWRFKYSGTWATDGKNGWLPEYQVNETPLTADQLAALNSGITSSDVALIGTALQPGDLKTVNNGTLDIQVNGTSVGTFTANQAGNTTANIVVPDSATWGNITGTLSNQTDLQTALDDKQDKLTIDTALSTTSKNPVQNKVITLALNAKQDQLTNDNAGNKIAITGTATTATGTDSVTFSSNGTKLNSVTAFGKCVQASTPTSTNPVNISCNNGEISWDSVNQEIIVTGTTETIEDSLENTATCQNLLAIDDYKDTQELLSGNVTRNVGIKVLDGSEDWRAHVTIAGWFQVSDPLVYERIAPALCTHYPYTSNQGSPGVFFSTGRDNIPTSRIIIADKVRFPNVGMATEFKAWLAQQYANGTPVIVVYPLATATTETVSGQELEIQKGSNTFEVTQSAITDLSLQVNYDEFDGNIKISYTGVDSSQLSYYGTCDTAADTRDKIVVCPEFTELKAGASIRVKFVEASTYNDVSRMNVNNTGLKFIYVAGGKTVKTRYYWNADEIVSFTYDGTYWVMNESGLATTTYYGMTKLLNSATNTSQTTAATPYSLNNLVQNMIEPYPVYSTSSTYAVGDRVRYSYQAWECITAITTAEAWTAAHWKRLDPIQTQLENKQATLVSGTNIKTLNGNSILGSGDLTLDGLPSQTGQSGKFLTTDGTDASWATVTIPTPTYDSTNERITW